MFFLLPLKINVFKGWRFTLNLLETDFRDGGLTFGFGPGSFPVGINHDKREYYRLPHMLCKQMQTVASLKGFDFCKKPFLSVVRYID